MDDRERKDFEAWAAEEWAGKSVPDAAWLGWKGRAALSAPPAVEAPQWIVNDLGELGVKVGRRFFFLYKGENLEYGEDTPSETALHDDGTPMRYRMVGKREFGEVQYPAKWLREGRSRKRYTEDLLYTPGLSFGAPEDGEWRDLPAARAAQAQEVKP